MALLATPMALAIKALIGKVPTAGEKDLLELRLEVRDLGLELRRARVGRRELLGAPLELGPWRLFQVVIKIYRMPCVGCGGKAECLLQKNAISEAPNCAQICAPMFLTSVKQMEKM